jgi:DNA polymerase-3 subunit delta
MKAKPAPAGPEPRRLVLVCGDDEFGVKQRARQLFQEWSAQTGGFDHEILDASVTTSGEALRALAKLREALQTLPFFGSAKVVWFKDCAFLADERAATQAVNESLNDLAAEFKTLAWDNLRLLISAGKVDKRRAFYKTLEKLGVVEQFTAWSADDKDWTVQAELAARRRLRELHKEIEDAALTALVQSVGPNARALHSEIDKLVLYVGGRARIAAEDVAAVVTRNKQARAFALADALGDRDLGRLLRALDEELWSMNRDSAKNAIGLLYGLVSKVRAMILAKELDATGLLKAEPSYPRFKAQVERLPADRLPQDHRFNPLAVNTYVLFKAAQQARHFTRQELISAMERLLDCNRRLISSSVDESLVLQQTLVAIVQRPEARSPAATSGLARSVGS